MEGLQISFFLKASVLQSKAALMGCFLPLLLILLLAFLQLESTFLPTIWHALPGLLEEPALAFLLLNCVTLTIIASSKLGSEERGHELEEDEGQWAMKVIEKGDEQGIKDVVETVIGLSLYLDTPVENGHQKGHDIAEIVVKPALYVPTPFNKTCQDFYKSRRGNFLRRSWSLNASFEYRTKHDPIKLSHVKESVKEKKPIRSRGRLGSRRNEKVGLHPNKPLSTELLKKQLPRGTLTFSNAADREDTHDHGEKPFLLKERCTITVDEQCTKGCRGPAAILADQEPRQAEDSAPAAAETAHPSMGEVWAAIMSAKKNDDRMASCMQVRKRSKKSNSQAVKQPPPAPAPTGMATRGQTAALVMSPAAAAEYTPTAAIASPKPAGEVPNKAAKNRAPAAAAKTHIVPGNGCTEMEELRQRADEFIQRFNRQMRLQREESLQAQRQTKRDRRRACNL